MIRPLRRTLLRSYRRITLPIGNEEDINIFNNNNNYKVTTISNRAKYQNVRCRINEVPLSIRTRGILH